MVFGEGVRLLGRCQWPGGFFEPRDVAHRCSLGVCFCLAWVGQNPHIALRDSRSTVSTGSHAGRLPHTWHTPLPLRNSRPSNICGCKRGGIDGYNRVVLRVKFLLCIPRKFGCSNTGTDFHVLTNCRQTAFARLIGFYLLYSLHGNLCSITHVNRLTFVQKSYIFRFWSVSFRYSARKPVCVGWNEVFDTQVAHSLAHKKWFYGVG